MASAAVYNAVKAMLVADLAPVEVLDYDQIEPQLEQGNAPFVAIRELFADSTVIGIGDPTALCVLESSGLIVLCFTPAPESSGAARALGDTVRVALRHRIQGHLRIVGCSPPMYDEGNNGMWTIAEIDVDAEMDSFEPLRVA